MKEAMAICRMSKSQLEISACHRFAYKKRWQPLTGSDACSHGAVPAAVSFGPVPGYA